MDDFVNQLLKDINVPDSMDPEVKKEMTEELRDRADRFVISRMLDAMSDEDLDAFDKLSAEKPDDADALREFLDGHVPEKDRVMAAALLEFRATFLGAKA
ncbi:hypothetical protein EBZ57_02485 [bacterium]|jgi:hypothetical protein|nr:hypothetical protein [bacterium]